MSETPENRQDQTHAIANWPDLDVETALEFAKRDGKISESEYAAVKERYKNDRIQLYKALALVRFERMKDVFSRPSEGASKTSKTESERIELAVAQYAKDWNRESLTNLVKTPEERRKFPFRLAEVQPSAIMHFSKEFLDVPYAADLLVKAASKDPTWVLASLDSYRAKPYAREVLLKIFEKNPEAAFSYHAKSYAKEPYGKEILLAAAEKAPFRAFSYFESYPETPHAKEVLARARNPQSISRSAQSNPVAAFQSYPKYAREPYAASILQTASEAMRDVALDRQGFLMVAFAINELHDFGDAVRFKIIDHFDAPTLYSLVVHGRSEVFTSTYRGIMQRLFSRMEKNGQDLLDIASKSSFEGFETFMEAAVSYGRMDELLKGLKTPEKRGKLLSVLLDESRVTEVSQYVAVIETVTAMSDPALLASASAKIRKNFETSPNKEAWGIIGKRLAAKTSDPFFLNLPAEYDLPELKKIPSKSLFDAQGRNVQRYYFYDDEDGKASFGNFISQYRGNPQWNIRDMGTYVALESKPVGGRKIVMFANKPQYDGFEERPDGSRDIDAAMASSNPPLEASVVVHRGHSYHAFKTIGRIPPSAKMVFLGSCGGFQNIGNVLDNAPGSHIVSTKAIGTKAVNDTLFRNVNERILQGKEIVWSEVWNDISVSLRGNPDFPAYVRPDKNLGAMFHVRYSELKSANRKPS